MIKTITANYLQSNTNSRTHSMSPVVWLIFTIIGSNKSINYIQSGPKSDTPVLILR